MLPSSLIQYQRVSLWRIPSYPLRPQKKLPSKCSSLHLSFVCSSKLSDFQDFQGYAKPLRLLPATEATTYKLLSPESVFSSIGTSSQSVYLLKLQTSNSYGSSLTDSNAGILVCLIDEKGNTVLQRIPAYVVSDGSAKIGDMAGPEKLHFQRGSVDEFVFLGPQLGQVEALWISLESGQWRLAGAVLTVINASQTEERFGQNTTYAGFHYDFRVEDVLLGEGGDISMLEAKPCPATELIGDNLNDLLSKGSVASDVGTHVNISKEESMKEYADLKFSLLFYDVLLVSLGTSIASFSTGESSALAFLTGGLVGFLYLLLLQRSVDGLPVPRSTQDELGEAVQALRGPIFGVAAVVVVSALAAKVIRMGNVSLVLSPREILFGLLGFLACKAAVVLAAFKPLEVGLKEGK